MASPPRPRSTSRVWVSASRRASRDVYRPRRHGGTNEAPLARWQAGGFLPNMPDSLEALDLLLLRVAKPRKVLRDGLRLGGRRYVEPTLAAFVGEMVEVLHDPRDAAEVRVYHQGAFLCRALSPEHMAAPGLGDIQAARRGARLAHLRGAKGEAPAARHGATLGITFDPDDPEHAEALAAVIRVTAGNFCLFERLLAQMRRLMALNQVDQATADVVQAARDCLVIGPGT